MRAVALNVYSISELSEEAKEKALNDYRNEGDYAWEGENEETLNKFVGIFPVKIRSWEYDTYRGDISFSMTCDDEVEEMSGIRLLKYIYNNYGRDLFKGKYFSLWSKREKGEHNPNLGKLKTRYSKVMFDNSCVLTGFCIDDDILEPVYKFLKNPDKNTTFKDLMEECLNNWVKACSNDMEGYYSMESFIDTAEANEWEFYEDGSMF